MSCILELKVSSLLSKPAFRDLVSAVLFALTTLRGSSLQTTNSVGLWFPSRRAWVRTPNVLQSDINKSILIDHRVTKRRRLIRPSINLPHKNVKFNQKTPTHAPDQVY